MANSAGQPRLRPIHFPWIRQLLLPIPAEPSNDRFCDQKRFHRSAVQRAEARMLSKREQPRPNREEILQISNRPSLLGQIVRRAEPSDLTAKGEFHCANALIGFALQIRFVNLSFVSSIGQTFANRSNQASQQRRLRPVQL
jgi:hypothetical protein